MKIKTVTKMFSALLLSAALISSMAACTDQSQKIDSVFRESPGSVNSELSEAEVESLMHQVAESETSKRYEQYLPEEVFANAEFFGIEREGDTGIAYVCLCTAEYAALKGKAYEMGGSSGEAILRFNYTESGIELTDVTWGADGSDHDLWIEKNFPAACLEKQKNYDAYEEDGTNKLGNALKEEVEKVMGVPVETENLLEISEENGTYMIIKTIESGEPGKDYIFDTEVVEEGNLNDLAE